MGDERNRIFREYRQRIGWVSFLKSNKTKSQQKCWVERTNPTYYFMKMAYGGLEGVTSAAFTRDGKYFVSGQFDGAVSARP